MQAESVFKETTERFQGAVALVCATEAEFESIGKIFSDAAALQDGILAGYIGYRLALLVRAGIGKVNAAVATALVIERFTPSAVICFGACGALVKGLSIYDVIVADSAYQHDFDTTALGDPDCCVCGTGIVYFPVDNRISNTLADACSAKRGIFATGDRFVEGDGDRVRAGRLGAVVCDMECAAIAQTCFLMNIPFAAIKIVSDTSNSVEYTHFLSRALQILKDAFISVFRNLEKPH